MVEQAERREGRRETGERELREAVETRGGREKGEREGGEGGAPEEQEQERGEQGGMCGRADLWACRVIVRPWWCWYWWYCWWWCCWCCCSRWCSRMRCCCWSTGSRLLTAPYACWRHLRFGVAGELVHNHNFRLGAVGLEEAANAWFCTAPHRLAAAGGYGMLLQLRGSGEQVV